VDPIAMDKHYGPSVRHLNTLPSVTHVKEEDEELQMEPNDDDGKLQIEDLDQNINEVINRIVNEVLHKDEEVQDSLV